MFWGHSRESGLPWLLIHPGYNFVQKLVNRDLSQDHWQLVSGAILSWGIFQTRSTGPYGLKLLTAKHCSGGWWPGLLSQRLLS